jgi:Uma2 family endonuclease
LPKVAQPAVRFTRADYDLLPEGLHVELIDGELLKMAEPTVRHQEIARSLFLLLVAHVGKRRVFFGPLTFAIDDYNALVPDVLVLRESEIPGALAKDIRQALVLGEVLSPSTASRDRNVKVAKYLAQGVEEVWLLDPKNETVEVHGASGVGKASGTEAIPSRAMPDLKLAVAKVFER